MNKIITFTINPALDKSTTVAGIRPDSKLRCTTPIYEAGGGGVNVSRAIKKLGGSSLSVYLAGGPSGIHLRDLITKEGIEQEMLRIEEWTRENLAVTDSVQSQQYRFGMPGPVVSETEWKMALTAIDGLLDEGDYLVGSGSLSPGIPDNFYEKVATIAKNKKVRFILDTSGNALLHGSKSGVFLLKPNLAELSTLCGVKSISTMELEPLSKKLIRDKVCEVLVVSMGPKGALMVTENGTEHISAPIVRPDSTIGAGDSMVAGMVLSLSQGKSFGEMVRYGVACGTAATMTPGTELCRKEDVDKLFKWLLDH